MNQQTSTLNQFQTQCLTGYRLPEAASLRRDYTRPEDRRSAYYLEAYDARTVFYDCVYLEQAGGHLFTAPRFLNLWDPFRAGLRQDGAPVKRVKRSKWLRCEQAFIPGPKTPMTLDIAGETVSITARTDRSPAFAGRNTLVAVSKNNRLDWIANWAAFHARDHGTSGVVIFDNGSTDYSVDDVAAALAEVQGIEQALVYSAPYPYGPADKSGRFDVSPRFFQSAMLNLARREALSKSRAVLSIDIDELVTGNDSAGKTIYDLAVRNPVGMVTIQGSWIYPAPDTEGPAAQPAHQFRADPDKKCNRKWCITPRGPMSHLFGWAVHQIGGIAQNIFTNQSKFRLIHSRACSTGWKKKRFKLPENLVADPSLTSLMSRHFGDAASKSPAAAEPPEA